MSPRFLPLDDAPAVGLDFFMVGSGARGDGADLSVALWADLLVGSRRGNARGTWPVSAVGREAGAAD